MIKHHDIMTLFGFMHVDDYMRYSFIVIDVVVIWYGVIRMLACVEQQPSRCELGERGTLQSQSSLDLIQWHVRVIMFMDPWSQCH